MENFRDGLNKIWKKDWNKDELFEAICELHDKFYEPLNNQIIKYNNLLKK